MKRHHSLVSVVCAFVFGLALVGCAAGQTQDQSNTGQNDNQQNNQQNNTGPSCGNGILEGAEQCDDGSENGMAPNACRTNCSEPYCGDGVVDNEAPYDEQCDPPDGIHCLNGCVLPQTACSAVDTYDTACANATTGQLCWDGGNGGELFCGCDPANGNDDCQVEGFGSCSETTFQCEQSVDCGDDAAEPNNDESTATSLSLDTPGTGAVCEFDDDWFTFTTGPADNAVVVTVTWTDDGGTDLDVRVTDCADTTVGNGWSTDLTQELVEVDELAPSTTYCVRVTHYSGPVAGGDVSYTVSVTGTEINHCFLDSECPGGFCPYGGYSDSSCQPTAPQNAGCGDDTAGDNDTSSGAEPLTSGVAVTEGTCDGEANSTVDLDWFVFTATQGQDVNITVDQAGDNTNGDVDVRLYNSTGDLVASAASFSNPEVIDFGDLDTGDHYIVVKFYDNQTGTPMDATYTITMTLAN